MLGSIDDDVGLRLVSLDLCQHLSRVWRLVTRHLLHELLDCLWRDLLDKLRRVLEARELDDLSQSGAILLQRHQRIVRAVLLDDLFLLLSQLGQEHHLLIVRTTPKGDVDDHIHGRVPPTRVNRDKLATKTDNLSLILVHRDQFKEPLKAPFKAIGKDTGDHLNAVLRGRQLSLNSRTGRRLKDISIKTLRGTRDACPLGLDFVHVGHHAKRLRAHKRG